MEFYRWETDYDAYKISRGKAPIDPYLEFKEWRIPQLRKAHVWPVRLIAEELWEKDGRPYYNVHPELVSKLSKVNLEKIPSHLIELPRPFKAIHVRFSQQHPEMSLTDACRVGGHPGVEQIPEGSFVHGILLSAIKYDESDALAIQASRRDFAIILEFGISTDFGNRQRLPTYGIFPLWVHENVSLADAIAESASGLKALNSSYENLVKNCFSLAVTIGFLCNSNSELIEPDILAKFRNDYDRGDETKRQVIAEKSRRKGKIGWNIGNDLMFLGAVSPQGSNGSGTGDRELQWAHVRTGHPHAVRYGAGKGLVKIMWFSPTVVRPDRPFKKD